MKKRRDYSLLMVDVVFWGTLAICVVMIVVVLAELSMGGA